MPHAASFFPFLVEHSGAEVNNNESKRTRSNCERFSYMH
jgi:hypothetical protein